MAGPPHLFRANPPLGECAPEEEGAAVEQMCKMPAALPEGLTRDEMVTLLVDGGFVSTGKNVKKTPRCAELSLSLFLSFRKTALLMSGKSSYRRQRRPTGARTIRARTSARTAATRRSPAASTFAATRFAAFSEPDFGKRSGMHGCVISLSRAARTSHVGL